MHFVCIYIYSSIFFMLITKLYMHVKVVCVPLFRPDDVGVHVIDPDCE